uniref:Cytochrome P450 n=1 Tax=Rhabditophanes sp. KR3021 TaxID=114890 RepID=A0AC35U5Q8_9BILA
MELKLWLALIGVLVFVFKFKAILRFIKDRYHLTTTLHSMEGPFALPIVGAVWMLKWNIEDFTAQLTEMGNNYMQKGTDIIVFWLGPFPLVCFLSPPAVEHILSSNEIIKKGPEYAVFEAWLGNGLLTSNGDHWRARRKLLTPTFHFNILKDFMKVHNSEGKILVEQLEKYSVDQEEFNIFPYFKRCALDVICETSMGTKVNAQTNKNHPYVVAIQRMNELSFQKIRMPWLWIKPIWYMTGLGQEYDTNLEIVTGFTRQVINERIEAYQQKQKTDIVKEKDEDQFISKKKAFLDLLIESSHEQKLSYEDIREEVDTFMFEGHDTTSSGMSYFIWCLAHYPEFQEKLIEEIDSVFGDSDRNCTPEDFVNMKYLDMCIKDSLRMFPSVPLFSRSVDRDFEACGIKIPKGATAVVSPSFCHRNPRVFKYPSQFNPDNFLPENFNQHLAYSYIPFSAGPRNCIGQKFAVMEEKTILSWFFRKYTVSSNKHFDYTVPCPEIILRPSKGVPVIIKKRKFN